MQILFLVLLYFYIFILFKIDFFYNFLRKNQFNMSNYLKKSFSVLEIESDDEKYQEENEK